MKEKYVMPAWLKSEEPEAAKVFETIFEVAEKHPDMTLAEYVEHCKANIWRASRDRLVAAEKRQFGVGV